MTTKIFTTYDSKAQLYLQPFHSQTTGMALRSFQDIANDKTHPIGQHPEDYCLYEIGEWDDLKGEYNIYEKPLSLGKAIEHIKQEEIPMDPKYVEEYKKQFLDPKNIKKDNK